ncbi:MAG: hypothetical protein M1819_006689 [Sarea resinae]|nr:MAG: hypothetical protein M1819_006689 [Sarea resinae]
MFNFIPLLGAQSSSAASQSLLELDGGVKILVDVGWDESFDIKKLDELERQVPTLSLILLTHATPAHLAAFAHCCKNYPLFTRIPIYATTPVISLGRTLLQDLYASTPLASTIIPTSSLSETSYSFSTSASNGQSAQLLLQPPTPQEIAAYFSLIHPLKYSQPHQPLPSPFSPPLNGLTITAYNAGHTLGGTIWHIQHGLESIVYAVDWNQARENVLAGAAWLGGAGAGGAEVIEQLRKPTALICSSRGAERISFGGGRKKRDELLLSMLRETIAKGGTVLIPTDSSARVLELAYLLEHAWRDEAADQSSPNRFNHAKLYLASKNIGATMRFARSMLEWMDEGIIREFETESSGTTVQGHKRNQNLHGTSNGARISERKEGHHSTKSTGPFDFQHLKLLERKKQIDRMLANEGPKVILASDTSLEWGFSRDVLRSIAKDDNNLVVLTERYSSNEDRTEEMDTSGIGCTLWDWWAKETENANDDFDTVSESLRQVQAGGRDIIFRDVQRVPLEGQELVAYQQYLATKRQLQNTLQTDNGTILENSADVVDDTSSTSSSSDESDSERQGKALNAAATMAHTSRSKLGLSNEDLGVNVLLRRKGIYDYDVRGKKGREKMFPFMAKRQRGDDFGDLIRPEEYLRAEERDEAEGTDPHETDATRERKLGQKRKWDNAGMRNGSTGGRMMNSANKRRQLGLGQVPVERLDSSPERNLEGADATEDGSESEAEPDEPPVGPSKVAFTTETVHLMLKIAFVDFAGLHDKRSLQMLIPLIQPRKLVLVGGTKGETLSLADDCRTLLGAESGGLTDAGVDVFAPTIGETIDASVDTNAWVVKLSEPLVKQLQWQNVRGLGVVTLTGRLEETELPNSTFDEQGTQSKKRKKDDGNDGDVVAHEQQKADAGSTKSLPSLNIIPPSLAAATRSVAQPLHVGDLRLADLRKLLQSTGHTAEFRGEGGLLIDGLVAVRKAATGKIEVEGRGTMMPGSRSRQSQGPYNAVKRKIYECLAVVTGG